MSHFIEFRVWKFCLLIVGVAILLALRIPVLWQSGEFVAEDSWVFFTDAWNYPASESILKPYAGYFHLLPRILAEGFSVFPVLYQPYLYAGFALFINAIILSLIYLPPFRKLIDSDGLRLLLVVVLAFSPHIENMGLLLGLHWYLAYAFVLTLMLDVPQIRNRQVLWWGWCSLCVWSSPSTYLLLPWIVFKWFRANNLWHRLFWVWVGLNILVVAAMGVIMRIGLPSRTADFTWIELVTAAERLIMRGWLGSGMLGYKSSVFLANNYPVILTIILIMLLVALSILFWNIRRQKVTPCVVYLIIFAFGMLLMSFARTLYISDWASDSFPKHIRYLTAPTLLLYVAVFSAVVSSSKLGKQTWLVLAGIILALNIIVSTSADSHWARKPEHFKFRDYITTIQNFEDSKRASSQPASLYIPADIPYWGAVLKINGGLFVPPEANLLEYLDAKEIAENQYQSWMGDFELLGIHGHIDHKVLGPLTFQGVEGGRIFFRDESDASLLTSPLLYPHFWKIQGTDWQIVRVSSDPE